MWVIRVIGTAPARRVRAPVRARNPATTEEQLHDQNEGVKSVPRLRERLDSREDGARGIPAQTRQDPA
jgi:hypothetical protein